MGKIQRQISVLLALCVLLPNLAVRARGSEDTEPYIQRLIQYYQYYQEDAKEEIDILLDYIQDVDPNQGELWREIMTDWAWCSEEMAVHPDVLPDGLPEDDSLCILVLGYGLNPDGTMQPELLARLHTALRSAEKYPNAYVAVTGGATGWEARDRTEAGEMARWLVDSGLDPQRLIIEDRAMSTVENATRVYRLLSRSYPSVTSVAVVSSSYHVTTGAVLFQTAANFQAAQGGEAMDVVGCAGAASFQGYSALDNQAWGIAWITGIPYEENSVPAL